MTREEMFQRLARIRQEVREMRRETDSPAVANALREMDVYCFEAMEYLGEPEELFPEEVL